MPVSESTSRPEYARGLKIVPLEAVSFPNES